MKFLFLLLFSFMLVACQTFVVKKEIKGVKNIVFFSFEMNHEDFKKEANVNYPNISFIAHSFCKKFVKEFNNNKFGVKLIFLNEQIFKKAGLDPSKKVSLIRDQVNFPWTFNEKNFSQYEIKALLKAASSQGYLILDLEASVWSQLMKGSLKIKSEKSRLVINKSVREQSTYIIQDENSPYVFDFDKLFDQLELKANHKKEIIKIYDEIAVNLANRIKKKIEKKLENKI